ncbi:hypothetical protein EB796_024129 [Bugula neritina]|uniref:Uncharacterized protein n=1 Tax=Bugula neritina TaxID=10212 RepID=A0A7J7IUE4_BUGNE|nr:hypothetical protein EB796_024129 [Bugula neritina]
MHKLSFNGKALCRYHFTQEQTMKMTEGPFTIHRIKTENLEFVTNIALQIKSKKKRIEDNRCVGEGVGG